MTNQPERVLDRILNLKFLIGQSTIGQEHVMERLLIGLLTGGNILLEGLPGYGVPVLPVNTAQEVAQQIRQLLGQKKVHL